eukprot:Skav226325  [mRNA]  locus=scaffold3301:656945:673205:- [translate_table: standard]
MASACFSIMSNCLVAQGAKVVSLSRSGAPKLTAPWVNEVSWQSGDVLSANLDPLMAGADAVISAIGTIGTADDETGNGATNEAAARAAKKAQAKRFVLHVETAVAFSGGGGRALAFTLGVLRALEHLGLMRQRRNPQLKDSKFFTPAPGRPKVFVVSTGSALPDDVDFCCQIPSLSPDDAKRLENQFQANFGYWNKDDIGEFLTRNQATVFEKDELLPLLCQLQSLKKQGKPTVAIRKLKVLPNSFPAAQLRKPQTCKGESSKPPSLVGIFSAEGRLDHDIAHILYMTVISVILCTCTLQPGTLV